MDADMFPGAETAGQPRRKGPEGGSIKRYPCIGNRKSKKFKPNLPGTLAFVRQAKRVRLPVFHHRNQGLNPALFYSLQFTFQQVVPLRANYDGQPRLRTSFDPEDAIHGDQTPQNLSMRSRIPTVPAAKMSAITFLMIDGENAISAKQPRSRI